MNGYCIWFETCSLQMRDGVTWVQVFFVDLRLVTLGNRCCSKRRWDILRSNISPTPTSKLCNRSCLHPQCVNSGKFHRRQASTTRLHLILFYT